MNKLTEEQISEIAQELDMGMICYIHKKSGKMESFPDELQGNYPDEELWKEDMDKVENNIENYIEINGMHSNDAYRLMEEFIYIMDDKNLALKLSKAINYSKPFHNFRYELEKSGEYLQKWYEFKAGKMIEWVKDQLIFVDIKKVNDSIEKADENSE